MQNIPVRITKLLFESEHKLLLQLLPMFVLVVSTLNMFDTWEQQRHAFTLVSARLYVYAADNTITTHRT